MSSTKSYTSPIYYKIAQNNSKCKPLRQVKKAFGMFSRNNFKLIPKRPTQKVIDFGSVEDISEIKNIDDEITTRDIEKNSLSYVEKSNDREELKRIAKEETKKCAELEEIYNELLEQVTKNEEKYKKKIAELQEKIADAENKEFVSKSEFFQLASRVSFLESNLIRKL